MVSTMSFLSLPPEIRLQIYGFITVLCSFPTPISLLPYYGLLLSCSKIYEEFETEVVSRVNKLLDKIKLSHPVSSYLHVEGEPRQSVPLQLRMTIPTNLADIANIRIGVPFNMTLLDSSFDEVYVFYSVPYYTLFSILRSLLQNIPHVIVYPFDMTVNLLNRIPGTQRSTRKHYIEARSKLSVELWRWVREIRQRKLEENPDLKVEKIDGVYDHRGIPELEAKVLDNEAMVQIYTDWHNNEPKPYLTYKPFDPYDEDQEIRTCAYLERLESKAYSSRLAHACDDFGPYEHVKRCILWEN